MGGPTQVGEAATPPIDLDTLTAPDLRRLMLALGLPVSEHMTLQEAEAALALAQVLPDRAWAALLNPGMTVRLEGAQGLAENSLEASLSRVQVAPGGERSQVLELSASLAVEAGLRSEALRNVVTPELIERLPEGARKTVRGWTAAKDVPLEASLEASAGERFTYQAVVPPDVGARIAAGDMSAAPNPVDPMGMPVGSSVLIRGEAFTAQSLSARYKWLQFDETTTALEGQGLGIRRVDEHIFEVTTGPMEAMERDSFLGLGYGDLSAGVTRDTRIEGQTISVAQLDLSTPEGRLAYEAFMQTGTVPDAETPGVPRVGERGQVSVSDSAGIGLNAGPLSLSSGIGAGLEATETRWADGTGDVATVWNLPSSGTYSRTHRLGADGAVDVSSRRWTATFQGVDADTASHLYGAFSDAGGPRVGFPESVTVTMGFTEADLMRLRDRAAELDARKFDQGDESWRPLASAQTPGEVFQQLFAMSNRKDATEIAHFLGSLQMQSPGDGALSGSLGFLSETTVAVQVSARGQRSDDDTACDPDALASGWVENHRLSDQPPQVTTTLPVLSPSPPEAGSLDDLALPGGTDPAPGFVAPPTLAAPPAADAAPVVGDTPSTAEPLPPASVTIEPQPPVPVAGAEIPAEPADPARASPDVPRAPGYDMQDGLLRPNEVGLGVLGLQTALRSQGYDVPTDMRFGPETEQALRDFQSRNGLKVDGIAGPQTFAALDPRSASHMADGLIRRADEGVGVLGTQTALREHGHPLAPDAVFGPETEGAVRDFQRDHGLAVDGIVGPKTSGALTATTHAALSPDQQRHLQLAREQLGPALSARGHSPEQVERICAAAMGLAQQHAERGPVKSFFVSKDGERVAVVQQSAPMGEISVAAALQHTGQQPLTLTEQSALAQEPSAQRAGGTPTAATGRAVA